MVGNKTINRKNIKEVIMENFIKKFAEQLLDQEIDGLSAATKFRDLDDWDSLTAMAVIAMIEDEYQVTIDDANFKKLNTIGEIYDYIQNNK